MLMAATVVNRSDRQMCCCLPLRRIVSAPTGGRLVRMVQLPTLAPSVRDCGRDAQNLTNERF